MQTQWRSAACPGTPKHKPSYLSLFLPPLAAGGENVLAEIECYSHSGIVVVFSELSQLMVTRVCSRLQIVKHEWPRNWPTFISDIVGASKTNKSLCQNNMAILKLLR